MDVLRNELKLALRRLLRARLTTFLALLILALGIGANSAIFTVVNAVLIRPLPFQDPGGLVRVSLQNRGEPDPMSGPAFLGLRERVQTLDLAVYADDLATLTGEGEPTRLPIAWVSDGYFEVMGVRPIAGRTFHPAENETGRDGVIILSEGVWRQRYGASADLVGSQVAVDGRLRTVVGILPERFALATGRAFWLPIEYDQDFRDPANFYALWLDGIGRLKSGVTREQARGDLVRSYADLQRALNQVNPRFSVGAVSLHDTLVRTVRTPLLLLLSAVGVVLLIACANLANLLLAQAAGRRTEFAVRRALGGSRGRIILQLLIESLVLAAAGGGFGLLLGAWGAALLVQLQPNAVTGITDFSMDVRVFSFTAAVALISAVIFGLAPALQVARTAPGTTLREGGRGSASSRHGNRVRNTLVVAETALAITLLVTAGLLLRSLAQVRQVDPGFAREQRLYFELQLPYAAYAADPTRVQFYDRLLQQLAAAPGVRSVAASNTIPLTQNKLALTFEVDGRAPPKRGEEMAADVRVISPDYLSTMAISLVRGRPFDERDRAGAMPVMLISDVAAAKFFPGEDPIGKTIRLGWTRQTDERVFGTIVGIVRGVRQRSLEQEAPPELYLPLAQVPFPAIGVVMRTADDPLQYTTHVRNTVRALDPNLAVTSLKTLETLVDESVADRRFYTLLLGSFAAVALLLAGVGIFGVISVMVAQRRGEIGVRMALGAAPNAVLRLIVAGALRLAGLGVLFGLVAALAVTSTLSKLLFQVPATDPLTFAGTAVLLLAVAAGAAALPARNAARVDPNVALRAD